MGYDPLPQLTSVAEKLLHVLLARALALLWAGFWMFFFVAESWAWHTPVPVALPWVGVGLLFFWRWYRGAGN
jgi:hypothetical protein